MENMHDRPLLSSGEELRPCEIEAPGALPISLRMGQWRLFTASSVDGQTIAHGATALSPRATHGMAGAARFAPPVDPLA